MEESLSTVYDWVDGWEVRPREDGSFGVYDAHGMITGPFDTRDQAMAEAVKLPKSPGEHAVTKRVRQDPE